MNLADELSRQARLRPDAAAACLPAGNMSFSQLETVTWKAAAYLHRNGVKPGDVVALSFSGELALLATILATARIGATVYSLPGNSPPVLRAEMAARANTHVYVTDHAGEEIAGLPHLWIDIDALARSDATVDTSIRAESPRAPFLIITGSGSTGRPKLFAVTHAQFLARISLAGETLSLSPADRYVSLVNLHFTSTKERYLATLFFGAAVVLFDGKQTDLIALCHSRSVTVLNAPVFYLEQLLASLPIGSKSVLASLRVLLVTASTVSDGLRRRIMETLSQALYVRYSTNESGHLTMAGPHEVMASPGTVGRPSKGVQVEVVDALGQPLPAGGTGLIRVKSPGMVDRYLNDDEATSLAFKDGWFYPGDLGQFAPNGHLIFRGRADHMMIMNGINIYPAEIECVVSRHPAVRDVVAVPLPSAIHQDIPVCAVVLQAGAQVSERQLLDFAVQRLGSHGPKKVFVLERIPRNEQGKLIRPQLMGEIAASLRHRGSVESAPASLQVTRDNLCPVKLRQPARQMRIRLNCTAPVDLGAIDDWLKSVLEIEVTPAPCLLTSPADLGHEQMTGLMWRILLLNSALLQAARIPVFDPGCVLRIERDRQNPSTWVATVAISQIDHIPRQCYSIAGDRAVQFIQWMTGKPRTPENAAVLFDAAQEQALKPLLRMVMAGKSTIPVLRAAYVLDIPFFHLGAGVYQLGWGNKLRRMDRSATEADSAIGLKLAQNKVWSANLLRMAGLPAPLHGVVATGEEATRVAHQLGWPVVVKPVDLDRGEGVTVGVTDGDRLLAAFETVKKLSKTGRAIIERHVDGVCHRLFIADDNLLYAVKRLPKSIHGDGRQTVAELIRAANQIEGSRPPWLRSEHYPADPQASEAMAEAGFALDSVPAAGERVPLRNIESTAWGGFDEDVTDRIHPDNLGIARRAATLLGLHVAGVDIITPDVSKPWHENGAIINEVNFAPLFGGGEISRSYIPEFLERFIGGDGRIPVEVVVGGDAALEVARARQREFVNRQILCFVTSHDISLDPSGDEVPFPFTSLYQRGKALLMDRRVGALILVSQTDELLRSGLPVDRIDRVTASGDPLKQSPPGTLENLLILLRANTSHS